MSSSSTSASRSPWRRRTRRASWAACACGRGAACSLALAPSLPPHLTRLRFGSYFFPSEKAGFDAQCFYWVRTSELAAGLEAHLGDTVRGWLASDAWPWTKVAFPGRDIPWDEWAKLPPA